VESWEEKRVACSCVGLVIDEKFNRFPHFNFPVPPRCPRWPLRINHVNRLAALERSDIVCGGLHQAAAGFHSGPSHVRGE